MQSKKFPIIMGITLVIYIFSFLFLQIIAKDKSFSELENRNLQQMPTFNTQSFLDGSLRDRFETYISDQFPLRNQFISLKSYSELALQKRDNNGVYIGKDGYLLQDFSQPDMDRADRNIGYINEFANEFNVYMLIAPTATKIYEGKLPLYATPYDEGKYIQYYKDHLDRKVNFVNLIDLLTEKRNESIYYKTDHHWTTLGAYYAYTAFCKTANLTPLDLADFNREVVTNDFYGTLFSKGNFTFCEPDTIEIFHSDASDHVSVNYVSNEKETDSLYELSHLKTKDKYSLFLDGNHPLITIKGNVHNGKKLMILKDSYANCFIPFLTAHYEEIHVIDLRFFNMPLATYARDNGIQDVLFLYNVRGISAEGKFSLLRK